MSPLYDDTVLVAERCTYYAAQTETVPGFKVRPEDSETDFRKHPELIILNHLLNRLVACGVPSAHARIPTAVRGKLASGR